MKLFINGEEEDLEVSNLEEVIDYYQLKREHVIAEVDGEIIDRTEWPAYQLKGSAKIELVQFVGGG